MADQDRVTYARAAGIIIYDFCKAMDVPILIMGHTDEMCIRDRPDTGPESSQAVKPHGITRGARYYGGK